MFLIFFNEEIQIQIQNDILNMKTSRLQLDHTDIKYIGYSVINPSIGQNILFQEIDKTEILISNNVINSLEK